MVAYFFGFESVSMRTIGRDATGTSLTRQCVCIRGADRLIYTTRPFPGGYAHDCRDWPAARLVSGCSALFCSYGHCFAVMLKSNVTESD